MANPVRPADEVEVPAKPRLPVSVWRSPRAWPLRAAEAATAQSRWLAASAIEAVFKATGAILRTIPLSAGTNAPVTVDGDYVIAGAGVPLSQTQRPMIIAYKLGAMGKLPETVQP
jgi:hypothetical protein